MKHTRLKLITPCWLDSLRELRAAHLRRQKARTALLLVAAVVAVINLLAWFARLP